MTDPHTLLRALECEERRLYDAQASYDAALLALVREIGYAEASRLLGWSRQRVRQLAIRAEARLDR